MSQLVGYHSSLAAQLEAPSPRELKVFLDYEMQQVPPVIDPDELLEMLNNSIRQKFGTKFSATWVSADTGDPADEQDDTVVLFVDAYTITTRIQ